MTFKHVASPWSLFVTSVYLYRNLGPRWWRTNLRRLCNEWEPFGGRVVPIIIRRAWTMSSTYNYLIHFIVTVDRGVRIRWGILESRLILIFKSLPQSTHECLLSGNYDCHPKEKTRSAEVPPTRVLQWLPSWSSDGTNVYEGILFRQRITLMYRR